MLKYKDIVTAVKYFHNVIVFVITVSDVNVFIFNNGKAIYPIVCYIFGFGTV